MFYPESMTEVQLIIPSKDVLAVTPELAKLGVFHQTDSSYMSSDKAATTRGSWQEKTATFASLERRVLSIMQGLDLEEGQPPQGDLSEMVDPVKVMPTVEQLENEVKKACDRLEGEQKELEQQQSTLQQLEPLAGIDVDMGTLRNPRYVTTILGIMPTDNITRLETSLGRIPFVLLKLRQENHKSVVWLAGPKNNTDIVDRAARSAYLNPIDLPETYQGTPNEIIERLKEDIKRTQNCISEEEKVIAKERDARQQQLQSLLWHIRASRLMANAIGHFGQLQYTYIVVGWVPTHNLPQLNEELKKVSPDTVVETFPLRRSAAKGDVPVALRNPGITLPFQSLVTTYARPRYAEIDPTILMAIMFPLLFGAMFGDVGQGALLVLLGLLISSKKVKPLQSLAGLGRLITTCGLSAVVFGFLYGSIFGVETLLPAIWIRPMDNIMQILIIAVGAGVVLLSIGFILGVVNALIARDWGRFFFDPHGVAGLVLYWSLLGLVATFAIKGINIPSIVFVIPAAIASVAIMFSELFKRLVDGYRPLIEDGIGTFIIQSVFELFETLISLLSNSLSYVRVGAFAVAHVGLSAVVFIFAKMASPTQGIGYWIVLAFGTLFIVGFEGLIVGIQTMRLSYYEFFSKFFTGGGARFEPLTLRPTKEEAR